MGLKEDYLCSLNIRRCMFSLENTVFINVIVLIFPAKVLLCSLLVKYFSASKHPVDTIKSLIQFQSQ